MKRLQRILIVSLSFFVCACGGGGGGGGGSVSAEEALNVDATVPATVMYNDSVVLDGSPSSSPDSQIITYSWSQKDGDPAVQFIQNSSNKAAVSFVADVPAPCTLTFILNIVDEKGRQGEGAFTVQVRAGTDRLKEALFAAYAGIGYRTLDDEGDNEYLYEMFTDNLTWLGLLMPIRIMEKCWTVDQFTYFLIDYNEGTNYVLRKYSENTADPGYEGVLTLMRNKAKDFTDSDGNPWYWFKAHSEATMDGDGMVNGLASYRQGRLTSTITGYFYYDTLIGKFHFRVKTFEVSTGVDDDGKPLVARYVSLYNSKTYDVTYQDWNINFNVSYGADDPIGQPAYPLNTYLLPSKAHMNAVDFLGIFLDIGRDDSYSDTRDYTIKGALGIRDVSRTETASYSMDMHYHQKPGTYVAGGKTIKGYAATMEGTVGAPDLPYPVSVSTGNSAVYVDASTGIWSAGALLINDGEAQIAFSNTSSSNTAGFSEFGYTASQTNWQTALAVPTCREKID